MIVVTIRAVAVILPLVAASLCESAAARVFGSLESGYASFSNFRAVASERETISESAYFSAANVGAYRVVGGRSTALLAKMGFQDVRFDESGQLDNSVVNGDLGLYHRFENGSSVMLLGGLRRLEFEDSDRDDRIASARLQFRKPFLTVGWRNEAYYEQGSETTLSGEYAGYGLTSSLSWSPHSKWQFSLGIGANRNRYDGTVQVVRETDGGLLRPPSREIVAVEIDQSEDVLGGFVGLKRRLRDWLYLSASVTHRRIRPESGDDLEGETYSLALGVRF